MMGTDGLQNGCEDITNQKRNEEWFIKNYPKTEDAFLVGKYFGNTIATFHTELIEILKLLLKGKEQELLELAKQFEAETLKRKGV